ncbi:MAG: hypothetical protein ABGX27_00215 [Desulfurobacteriaceae bacterium]
MTVNLAEIGQKLDRLIYNMSEQNKRAYSVFYDPNPQDVELPQLDENGNLVTVKIPNRAKILADFETWREGARGEYPITPNLLKNTRFFKWSGEVVDSSYPYGSKDNTWFDNTLPLFWGWYNFTDSSGVTGDTTFKAKTIHVKNTSAWNTEGLPSLDQVPLVRSDGYGAEFTRALVLEISRTQGGTVILSQDCYRYTSWHAGDFTITEKFYFAILSRTGDIKLTLPGNRFPTLYLGEEEQGVWHHITIRRQGFGGCIQGYVSGSGTMKVAILLPFVTFGYLPDDMHVWAGYVGSDATAYSHGDLIVSSSALAKEPW